MVKVFLICTWEANFFFIHDHLLASAIYSPLTLQYSEPLSLTGVRVSQGKQLLGRPPSHLLAPSLSERNWNTYSVGGRKYHRCIYVCVCSDNIPRLTQTLTCLAGVWRDSCDLGDLSTFDTLWLEFDLLLDWLVSYQMEVRPLCTPLGTLKKKKSPQRSRHGLRSGSDIVKISLFTTCMFWIFY